MIYDGPMIRNELPDVHSATSLSSFRKKLNAFKKNLLNIKGQFASLRRKINRCYHLLNKNKGQYYQDLVEENSGDGKRLWQALSKVLGRFQVSTLPSRTDENHWLIGLVDFL